MSRAAQTSPQSETTTAPGPIMAPEKGIDLDAELQRLDRERARVPVVAGQFVPDSLEGYQRLARAYIMADLVPYTFKGTGQNRRNDNQLLACVTLVLAAGMGSLKLTPEQALSSMMVVNNRTALFGDVLPALIRGSGKCLGIDERMVGEGDARTAVCKMTRMHRLPDGTIERETIERRFSVADAKTAKLWGKKGYEGKDTPWITNPERMLQMRARGFAARDGFADVLMGMGIFEELQDIEPQESPKDRAASATEAIDALKAAQSAQNDPTPQGASKAKGGQTTQIHTQATTPPTNTQASDLPAGKPGTDEESQDRDEGSRADAGNGQEHDQESREAGESAQMEDSPSQLTQGTDAETAQAAPKKTTKPPKGKGDASAEPPETFFEQQKTHPTNQPPTRPWKNK